MQRIILNNPSFFSFLFFFFVCSSFVVFFFFFFSFFFFFFFQNQLVASMQSLGFISFFLLRTYGFCSIVQNSPRLLNDQRHPHCSRPTPTPSRPYSVPAPLHGGPCQASCESPGRRDSSDGAMACMIPYNPVETFHVLGITIYLLACLNGNIVKRTAWA